MESGYDGSVIEISTFTVGQAILTLAVRLPRRLHGTIAAQFQQSACRKSAWTGGVIGTWSQVVVNLSSYAGQTAILAFPAGSDKRNGQPGLVYR